MSSAVVHKQLWAALCCKLCSNFGAEVADVDTKVIFVPMADVSHHIYMLVTMVSWSQALHWSQEPVHMHNHSLVCSTAQL